MCPTFADVLHPFETRFTTPDTSIRPRLSNPEVAGSAILAWAVLGCLAWQTVGVGNLPEKVRQATESYRAEMDPLSDWLEDSCVVIDNIWTPVKSLWSNYMEWSKENHLRYPLGRKTFSQRLKERFSELRRGKTRDRGFVGLGVKRPFADASEMSATPDDPVDSQISFFMEENLESKCPQMSAESPTCELCGQDDFRYSAAGELVCASCFPDA